MKHIAKHVLLGAALALAVTGCGAPQSTSADKPESEGTVQVVVSNFPGYDFVRQIGGEAVSVKMLLPPGAESHSFEPTPQDIITIDSCDLFVYVGGESDAWVDGILDSMEKGPGATLKMMDTVQVVEEEIKEGMQADAHEHEEDHAHDEDEEHGHADEHDHEEAEYDEHVWTSPINAMQIVQAIGEALCTADPARADAYRENTAAYAGRLAELDDAFRAVVDARVRDTLIFGDRFPFRYFVDEYGLDYYAAFPGCSTETEPSAKTVAFLIDKVEDEAIPVVFHIEFSNKKMANTIAEHTGAAVLQLHSCHNVTKEELESGMTYLDFMQQNVEALREALT